VDSVLAREPVVVLIDIESSPELNWTWGRYEVNALKNERNWEMLSFAWKTLGSKRVECLARPDFKDKTDRALTCAAWKVLNDADVVVGHNVDKFDNRKLRAKFVQYRLPPPRPYKTIDTLKIARKHFAFSSNKLADLGQTLGVGEKLKTGGLDLWFACMAGDRAAWRKMVAYNKRDVVLLEAVYERLKAWHTSHPNMPLHSGAYGCPVCSSVDLQRRGYVVSKVTKSPRWQCQSCGHWFSSARLARDLAAAGA
jgi:hypothetical protein